MFQESLPKHWNYKTSETYSSCLVTESKYVSDTSKDNSKEIGKLLKSKRVSTLILLQGILTYIPDDKISTYVIATQNT